MTFDEPSWPFVLRLAGIILGVVLLAWFSGVRTSRSRRPLHAAVHALGWCTAATATWMVIDSVYLAAGAMELSLPGGNWEYEPPPDSAVWLGVWLVAGSALGALLLGLPVASVVAIGSWLLVCWRDRPSTRPRHAKPAQAHEPRRGG